MKVLLPPALALVVLLNSCDGGGRAVPRPEGYPRIALYEAVYRSDSIGPVIFESNAGTAVTERRQGADGTGMADTRLSSLWCDSLSDRIARDSLDSRRHHRQPSRKNIAQYRGRHNRTDRTDGQRRMARSCHAHPLRLGNPPSDTRHFAVRRLRCQRSAFPRKSGYSHFSRLAGTRSRSRPR